jgi:hypothetical protein
VGHPLGVTIDDHLVAVRLGWRAVKGLVFGIQNQDGTVAHLNPEVRLALLLVVSVQPDLMLNVQSVVGMLGKCPLQIPGHEQLEELVHVKQEGKEVVPPLGPLY